MDNVDKIGIVKIQLFQNNKSAGSDGMKIKNISITGIGGIKHLELDFNSGINLICGANGVGKTTILECIAYSFGGSDTSIKRNSQSDEGIWNTCIEEDDNNIKNYTYKVSKFTPFEQDYLNINTDKYTKVIVFKTHRDIPYLKIDYINRDRTTNNYDIANKQNKNGVDSNEIKAWFINRYLWSAHENALDDNQKKNFKLAIDSFNKLDNKINFLEVNPTTYDIIVKAPTGDIYYEYLSSGYKSCIHLILGIIKEIEYRFKNPTISIEEFDGIILIDEIDLHLHPEWQSKLILVLKEILPKAQIIATTHSPHMIQSVLPNEIIPLAIGENAEVYKKELSLSEYGLQGWTIEEILVDVMGLKSTSSALYEKTIKDFEDGIIYEDVKKINESYKILKKMLHPNNPLRKIFEIQMAGFNE